MANEIIAYHGSPNEFTDFDERKISKYNYGYGFYFTSSEEMAKEFANVDGKNGKVYKAVLPPEEFLIDYEKQVKNQSQYIIIHLTKLINDKIKSIDFQSLSNASTTVEDLLYAICSTLNIQVKSKEESELLYQYGIKGIKYEQPLYDRYKGTINYVIFNKNDIQKKEIFNESKNTFEEKTLYIIRGVPGSGKTTLAKKLVGNNYAEADQFMYVDGKYDWKPEKLHIAHKSCYNKIEKFMKQGVSPIAVSNTFVKLKNVKPYRELAEKYGYNVDEKICRGNYQNEHNVSPETVEKMRRKFQESDKEQIMNVDDKVEEAYNQYKEYLKSHNNKYLLMTEKEGSHLWWKKQILKEFNNLYPNSIYEMILKEDGELNYINRIAGIYNPYTKEDDDSIVHKNEHKITDEMFENGWSRYMVIFIKGKYTCYISASVKETVMKAYKYIKNKYKDIDIKLYVLDWLDENNDVQSLYLDENGHKTVFENFDIIRENINKRFDKIIKENKLEEMAYPANFDLRFFSQIPTFKERIKYCDERLQKLGTGTSRIVYKVDNEKVLKIAKNRKGIAQNEHEADWGRNQYDVFAEIYDADTDNYTWIEMEIAKPAKKTDFKRLLGVTWEDSIRLLRYMFDQSSKSRYPSRYSTEIIKLYEKLVINEESDFFTSLHQYIFDYQPWNINDWTFINNWGIVNRNGRETPVIIDDGLSEDIFKQFYMR